jgi:hypothetical protein
MSDVTFWFIIGTQVLTMIGWALAISIIRNLIRISRAHNQLIGVLLWTTSHMRPPTITDQ